MLKEMEQTTYVQLIIRIYTYILYFYTELGIVVTVELFKDIIHDFA